MTMATRTLRPTKGKAAKAANETGVRKTLGKVRGIAPGASKAATSLPVRTTAARLVGNRPSRTKALLTASVAAFAGAALVYRLLRSGDGDGDE
jgi:hypothetical protein